MAALSFEPGQFGSGAYALNLIGIGGGLGSDLASVTCLRGDPGEVE